MKNKKQTTENQEMTIHSVLAGILLNGFIQGKEKIKLDSGVLEEAQKDIEKVIRQAEQRERQRVITEIRKAKAWKLVPNTPRMIMISDKDFQDLLENLIGAKASK